MGHIVKNVDRLRRVKNARNLQKMSMENVCSHALKAKGPGLLLAIAQMDV